ncbi:uncharacterized protein LOC119635420 [Glossina fuscipes]|uniref:Uncharacterized protein LOC119635420 n=1 Tax=Glossina fuscipes TaxID=7396 RepID=A0A8U0WM03_9MUSC|nr:uncharacterized protein LOC119635420 [Glossina fuscipes]
MHSFYRPAVIFISILITVQPAKTLYRLIFDDPDIFWNCLNRPRMRQITDAIDISGLDITYNDEGLHVSGSAELLWDIQQTDRITLRHRYEPFLVHFNFEDVQGINMEGRYKIVGIFEAYDENNQPRPDSLCGEAPCEIIKV